MPMRFHDAAELLDFDKVVRPLRSRPEALPWSRRDQGRSRPRDPGDFLRQDAHGVERNDVAARLCCLPSRQARMPARSILPPIMIVAAYFPQAAQKIKIPEKFLRRIVSPAIDSAKGERRKAKALSGRRRGSFQHYCLNKDLR